MVDEIRQVGKNQADGDGTRGRERNIGYVIEKVTQWRRLYNGFYDEDFNHHRMTLEKAAEKVGVSKKSLDDYLAQLRAGRQFGYDFNANKEMKIGHLRHFVKQKLGGGDPNCKCQASELPQLSETNNSKVDKKNTVGQLFKEQLSRSEMPLSSGGFKR